MFVCPSLSVCVTASATSDNWDLVKIPILQYIVGYCRKSEFRQIHSVENQISVKYANSPTFEKLTISCDI